MLTFVSISIHRSLPRTVSADSKDDDVADWDMSSTPYTCPGQSTLVPWLEFARLTVLYKELLMGQFDNPSSQTVHAWLEGNWRRWRGKWLLRADEHGFERGQVSMVKIFDALFLFHLREYGFFYALRHSNNQDDFDRAEATQLPIAFSLCVDAALAIGDVFQADFVQHDYLSYCFDLLWVALVISMVWLVRVSLSLSLSLYLHTLTLASTEHDRNVTRPSLEGYFLLDCHPGRYGECLQQP